MDYREYFMNTELFIITGASGTGKSTSVSLLKKKLPADFLVYDYDEILRPYDFTETWGDEVVEKMLQITSENIKNNITTVFLGLIRPHSVKEHQNKHDVHTIKLLLLDISTEERARRLKQRGSSMSLVYGIEEHEGFRSWISEADYENSMIDVTNLNSDEVVQKIYEWVMRADVQQTA